MCKLYNKDGQLSFANFNMNEWDIFTQFEDMQEQYPEIDGLRLDKQDYEQIAKKAELIMKNDESIYEAIQYAIDLAIEQIFDLEPESEKE